MARNLDGGTAMEGETTRAAGRPPTIDADSVARIAMDLFARNGYGNTSMADIAQAAGIGRKSLYRYFATKADLVWGGMEPALQASLRALDAGKGASGAGSPAWPGPPISGLADAVAAGAAALPDPGLARARLRLIAEHPELLSHSHEALGAQRREALAYLSAAGVPQRTAGYVCAAFIAATFQAWLEWAAGTDADPTAYLRAAAGVLRIPSD
ncbi:TetR family transcriptional regulator [Pseudarthrobacter sp. NPDC058119]|uniref:TetR family transcriptional regulator n=1 Tax=Pseudarthrobacter sp. NPDC058119 TaxID=3346348 RepID=UPI0036DAE0C6